MIENLAGFPAAQANSAHSNNKGAPSGFLLK
jgi:hypothetical protein